MISSTFSAIKHLLLLLMFVLVYLVLVPVVTVAALLKGVLYDPIAYTIPDYIKRKKTLPGSWMEQVYRRLDLDKPLPKLLWDDLGLTFRSQWHHTKQGFGIAWEGIREGAAGFVTAVFS